MTQTITKRWQIAPHVPEPVQQALIEFPPLLRQLLFNRGITDAESARSYILGEPLGDTNPLLMSGMPAAVDTLHQAVQSQSPIAIYGDYDVDGVTASALLYEFLQKLGLEARVYIPNRFDEGYGVNLEAIQTLADEGIKLIITVDCGIRSTQEIALANNLGMGVIITDHHLPGDILPEALAVVNPHQEGDVYPYKYLAGVGLAYKLAQAYLQVFPVEGVSADDWLDLVALGTVADVAPLTGENRFLVRKGLQLMRGENRQGLFSLCKVAGVNMERLTASHIGFWIAPRLNAAGRMDSAVAAFDLLTSRDLFTAGTLAQQLHQQNSQRKEVTAQIQSYALAAAQELSSDNLVIFVSSPDFNEGVVGLAAGRVVDAVYKPTIIGHQSEESTKASCRSIPEFNIHDALEQCRDLLERFGGHAMAAGLTVRNENQAAFIERINQIAKSQLAGLDLRPSLNIDREIFLDKLEPAHIPGIMEDVSLLEPTGCENPSALFCSRDVEVVNWRTVGSDGQHLKLTLKSGSHTFDAIAFGMGYWAGKLPDTIDIVYTFDENEFNGRTILQLRIEDIQPSSG